MPLLSTPTHLPCFISPGILIDRIKLWQEAGVRALPGAYLSRPIAEEFGGGDPGTNYLRLALEAPADDVARGLNAVREVLL